MTTNKTAPRVGAVGDCFHTFNDNGMLKWQGEVVDCEEGYYLVNLYDWFAGCLSDERWVAVADTATWIFYSSPQQLQAGYRRLVEEGRAE